MFVLKFRDQCPGGTHCHRGGMTYFKLHLHQIFFLKFWYYGTGILFILAHTSCQFVKIIKYKKKVMHHYII
jgi:hypothetical protein